MMEPCNRFGVDNGVRETRDSSPVARTCLKEGAGERSILGTGDAPPAVAS